MLRHTEAGERLAWDVNVADRLSVPVDPHDFRELVGNLLENACKWARTGFQTVETDTPARKFGQFLWRHAWAVVLNHEAG
ncbi:hypothetical protein ACC730_38255, partial [Rhizobium ruizarguesonis]